MLHPLRLRARALRNVAGIAALMLTASCASPTDVDSAPLNRQERLQRSAQRDHVCAVAVALIRQRELESITTASGCEPTLPVNEESVFQAASLSKPMFGYAVLKLVRQGRMDLDAPVLRYLPRGYRHAFDPMRQDPKAQFDDVTDPRLSAVTVRMLLQHTAGLPNWASGPLRFEASPGARWSYSGEGFVLLQRAVEAVTGHPLGEVMRDQVFVPLGMTHSSYRWTPEIGKQLLPATKGDGSPRNVVPMLQPVAAFSLFTSVRDYAKFLVALLHDEQMLATIVASHVEVDATANLSWGLGWGLETSANGVQLWQWGNNPGYRTFATVVPGSGDGIVVMTNSDDGLRLARTLVKADIAGDHAAFDYTLLKPGIFDMLCSSVRICL